MKVNLLMPKTLEESYNPSPSTFPLRKKLNATRHLHKELQLNIPVTLKYKKKEWWCDLYGKEVYISQDIKVGLFPYDTEIFSG